MTGDEIVSIKSDTFAVKEGTLITNGCWTAVHARYTDDNLAKLMAIAGIFASAQSCLKTVVDGYTLSGYALMGKAGNNFTGSNKTDGTSDANAASPVADANSISFAELDDVVPFNVTTG